MSDLPEGCSKLPFLLIFVVSNHQGSHRTPNAPLSDYINAGADGDPYHPQRLVSPANGPFDPEYCGGPPRSVGTSIMVEVEEDDKDQLGSLPSLNRSMESVAFDSPHSSMGERQLTEHSRMLNMGPDRSLVADGRPQIQRILQCPFQTLGCMLDFRYFHDWFWHSLTHFQIGRSKGADGPAIVMPPTQNRCGFCPKTFSELSGFCSWHTRMRHVETHHGIGHSLSIARPDFQLFEYLWENHLIDEIVYRDIRGNTPDRSRSTYGNPSPPTSEHSDSPPSIPTGPVGILNERRHNRRTRPR